MMNVNMSPQSSAQVARAAQNVGFIPQMAPKEVKKEETRSTTFIDETHKDETDNTSRQAGTNAAMGQASTEQQAAGAAQRRISKNNMFGHQREEYTAKEKPEGGSSEKAASSRRTRRGTAPRVPSRASTPAARFSFSTARTATTAIPPTIRVRPIRRWPRKRSSSARSNRWSTMSTTST